MTGVDDKSARVDNEGSDGVIDVNRDPDTPIRRLDQYSLVRRESPILFFTKHTVDMQLVLR